MERGEGAEGTPGISSSGLEILLPSRDAGKAHTSGFLLRERACLCLCAGSRCLCACACLSASGGGKGGWE